VVEKAKMKSNNLFMASGNGIKAAVDLVVMLKKRQLQQELRPS
jgi:hypothetical protein